MTKTSVAIVGGGIVGLATAYQLTQRFPDRSVVVLEKESSIACHQTGHNSGVLHSGIYYAPGSLKATNCLAGRQAMIDFCRSEAIDHDICGKIIVAVNEGEFPALERIAERGRQNQVQCKELDRTGLLKLEPHCAGIRAIHVPEAGIVNYHQVAERLAQRICERGGEVRTKTCVKQIRRHEKQVILSTDHGEVEADYHVNCAGLYSDRVTKLSGEQPQAKIVPFRGEYYKLLPDAKQLVNNLIYPVPDPSFPFLGVHFTRMIDGEVECGPNAVLAFAREGYTMSQVNLCDLAETLTYKGFLKLAAKYWRVGMGEMWRSLSKQAFVKELRRLIPDISANQLESAPAGVRAQAVAPEGSMVDDFLIQESERVINVGNAPSPAATASLNIGNLIVDRLADRWS